MGHNESLFYHQMAHLLDAGITLPEAIHSLLPESPRSLRFKLNQVYESLKMGELPIRAFAQAGFGKLELALIEVAEQTGNLSDCFRQLQQHSERMEALRKKLQAGLAYPIFLLFVAPALINLYLVFQSKTSDYFLLLAKSYFSWLSVVFVFFCIHSLFRSSYLYNSLLNQLPLLGSIRRKFAIARFTSAMAHMLDGGISVSRALKLASEASNNVVYTQQLGKAYTHLQGGTSLTESLAMTQALPTLSMQFIRTGETSGHLVESFHRLSKMCLEEAENQLVFFGKAFPALVYFGIALYIGYQIITFYSGYIAKISAP